MTSWYPQVTFIPPSLQMQNGDEHLMPGGRVLVSDWILDGNVYFKYRVIKLYMEQNPCLAP